MDLKARILENLGREQMRMAVDTLGLPVTDRRRNDALRTALDSAPQATPRALLEALPLPDLRQLCAAVGAPAARSRAETVERLLALTVPAVSDARVVRAATPPAPLVEPRRTQSRRRSFAAIDFETADNGRDSACAVAIVRVQDGVVVDRANHLIRPPRSAFLFTHIHGIRWTDVRHAPTFGEIWPRLLPLLDGVDFLAAHNAPFDRSVLQACCTAASIRPPLLPFVCTVQVARSKWDIRPTKLPDVCGRLGIPLRHHDAASDAEACARIVLEAGADTEAEWRGALR